MYLRIPKSSPIVQKYGGTSVGTTERIRDVAKRVGEQYRSGWTRLAIVVSAMSGDTNRLVALVRAVNPDAPAKAYDMAVATGEQVSVALMTAALAAEGILAEPFLSHQLGIITDEFHSKARIKSIQTNRIMECWERGGIPVVAGFQGVTESLDITTLGRGGSDTSAVALAIAVNAAFCEINTDVDGVYTSDPRIVPTARLIEDMDFEVALEMASLGSKVLHPRCVELGAKFQMPIVVRNTFTANEHRRTRVMNLTNTTDMESPTVSGVTLDRDVAKITLLGLAFDTQLVSDIFTAIAKAGVNVDIIVHNFPETNEIQASTKDVNGHRKTMHLGFTTTKGELDQSLNAIKSLSLKEPLNYTVEADCAKVSVVGVGMRSHPGVAAKTFAALSAAKIDIRMISTSEIKISCVVDAGKADDACRVLHKVFVDDEADA
jgi:aspartate kinase